jgi:hypothetical protein
MKNIFVTVYACISFFVTFMSLLTLLIVPDVDIKDIRDMIIVCLPGIIICISMGVDNFFYKLHDESNNEEDDVEDDEE